MNGIIGKKAKFIEYNGIMAKSEVTGIVIDKYSSYVEVSHEYPYGDGISHLEKKIPSDYYIVKDEYNHIHHILCERLIAVY